MDGWIDMPRDDEEEEKGDEEERGCLDREGHGED